MLSNEELNFVYKVAKDLNEIKAFMVSNNKDMGLITQLRLISFPLSDNGGSQDPCCNARDIDYASGDCGKPDPYPQCPEGYKNCSDGSDGSLCLLDDGIPCYSYICQKAVCKKVSYSTYLFSSLQSCQAYCQTKTPDPTLPPPNIFYYKCQSEACVDCQEDPNSCQDKDCEDSRYYCNFNKDRAKSSCENDCAHCVTNCVSNGVGVCGMDDGCGGICQCAAGERCENNNCVPDTCGSCTYTYVVSSLQDIPSAWTFSDSSCSGACHCLSGADANTSPHSAGGCSDQSQGQDCVVDCSPYFMFMSKEDKIEW